MVGGYEAVDVVEAPGGSWGMDFFRKHVIVYDISIKLQPAPSNGCGRRRQGEAALNEWEVAWRIKLYSAVSVTLQQLSTLLPVTEAHSQSHSKVPTGRLCGRARAVSGWRLEVCRKPVAEEGI